MTRMLLRLVEVVALRAGPGLLMLVAILLLGQQLSVHEYGRYSTLIATTGMLSSIFYGPITFSIVPQHALWQARGEAGAYESTLVSTALLISIVLCIGGALLWLVGGVSALWLPPTVAFGIYALVQEIPHARLKLWSYGAAAFFNSAVFLGLIAFLTSRQIDLETAVLAFSLSFALASVVSLALSGFPRVGPLHLHMVRSAFKVGGAYVGSTVVENGLYLGVRYVLLMGGAGAVLGVFSFCVDVAQRFVGFIINAAGFAFVPEAFKKAASGSSKHFERVLKRGALLACVVALLSVAIVLGLSWTGRIESLSGPLFDPLIFCLVAAAVIVNRTKKLVLDSVAIHRGRAHWIVLGYAVGVPVGLIGATTAVAWQRPELAVTAYFLGYFVASVVALCGGIAVRPRLEGSGDEGTP